MTASDFFSALGASIKSVAKMALESRATIDPRTCVKGGDAIVILGNGPSLKATIAEQGELLAKLPTVAVNFMANAPEYQILKPDYYILADPHFFTGLDNANVQALWKNLAATPWPMTLCIPVGRRPDAIRLAGTNPNIKFATFNFVGVEGFEWLEDLAYSARMGMPRPRNVLIPAIMCAIAAGYRRIYLAGADHSWMETIRVNEQNHVISVQPHFYADSKEEQTRSATEYKGYRLHDIVRSFYIAFRSYHSLQRHALAKGISIYNSTPGSYIDAFPRRPIGS